MTATIKPPIHQHVAQKVETPIDHTLAAVQKMPIEDMPLDTLRDYRLYNEAARAENKKLRICRHPIKQCPVELHPKQRIKFTRMDQPSNPLPVFVSDDKIHFEETLIPGKEYDLPEYIIHYLQEKGNPVWKWFSLADGSRETRMSHREPRFNLRPIYKEAM